MPFDAEDSRGIVYVWIGSKADPEEATVAEEIAYSLYDTESFSLQVVFGNLKISLKIACRY